MSERVAQCFKCHRAIDCCICHRLPVDKGFLPKDLLRKRRVLVAGPIFSSDYLQFLSPEVRERLFNSPFGSQRGAHDPPIGGQEIK